MHENVAEVPPGLGPELGVVREWALQEGRAGHLQDQAVQLEAVVHEDGYLRECRQTNTERCRTTGGHELHRTRSAPESFTSAMVIARMSHGGGQ